MVIFILDFQCQRHQICDHHDKILNNLPVELRREFEKVG